MKTLISAFLLSLALISPGVAQTAPPLAEATPGVAPRPAEWATPVDPSRNLYQITPWLYRSTQPEQSDAAWLKKLGIRTIINFRANHKDEDVLDLTGVKLVSIPIDTWNIGDEQIISALHAIEEAKQEGPVLIHCLHGADRTGTVAAMYRILEQGWTREQALRELKQGNYGFRAMWVNIPRYIERANIENLRTRLARE
ncbi:MAG: dual specificity protein phosphatase family protein [Azonexus sp.]|jgi:protein tyrosine/serine phosphatase|uniref:dual specificity protein phosphatase family protein n=1 Tax=Azonexus sp. TaxID=1872668 RepID=UPI00281FC2F8|nr:dual specificity protein phosphatase family protein [Azonexus sp.]MDR0775178.1 dual specificity protein phosphatase family protein [Azonexus sp.]